MDFKTEEELDVKTTEEDDYKKDEDISVVTAKDHIG